MTNTRKYFNKILLLVQRVVFILLIVTLFLQHTKKNRWLKMIKLIVSAFIIAIASVSVWLSDVDKVCSYTLDIESIAIQEKKSTSRNIVRRVDPVEKTMTDGLARRVDPVGKTMTDGLARRVDPVEKTMTDGLARRVDPSYIIKVIARLGNGDKPSSVMARLGNGDKPSSIIARLGNGDKPSSVIASLGNGDKPSKIIA